MAQTSNQTTDQTIRFGVAFKLLALVFVVTLGVIGVQTWLSLSGAITREKEAIAADLTGLYNDFNQEVKIQEDASAALSIGFADRADIRELYQAGDRAGLLSLLTPVFNQLSGEYNIVHLYVHNPDGTVFVRVHNPQKFGDDITYRKTAATALETQTTVPGVEIGPGRLGIRSVSPLYDGQEFVGLVEVGLDYDQDFMDRLKAENNADYTLWVSKEAAAPADLSAPENAPDAPTSDFFFYATTLTNPNFNIDPQIYQTVLTTGQPAVEFVSSEDNEALAVIVAPLYAYGDRIIGAVEIIKSRNESLAGLQTDILQALVVALVLVFVALFVLWLSTNRVVLRPLARLTTVALQQLQGNLAARVMGLPRDEFGQLGQTLNTLTEQLDTTLKSQEVTIAERTNQLQLTLNISQRLSSILDIDELLQEVVDLVHDNFNLYHAHIYLVDELGENLVVAAGYGEAGAALKATAHTIPISSPQSLVARAARTNISVRVENVQEEPNWLPNPLLPNTRSEMAVPVIFGSKVLGVLDVQSDQIAGLGQEDATTLSIVAEQIAIAINNAEQFRVTSEALAEVEKIQQLYVQTGWQKQLGGQNIVYEQVKPDTEPVDVNLLEDVKNKVSLGQPVVIDADQKNKESVVAIPLSIQGQVLGHIRVHNTNHSRQWSSEEVALIESVGEQMSLALENARLFDESRQRAGREQTIREITDKLRAAPNIDSLLETAARELGARLGVRHTVLELGIETEQTQSAPGSDLAGNSN